MRVYIGVCFIISSLDHGLKISLIMANGCSQMEPSMKAHSRTINPTKMEHFTLRTGIKSKGTTSKPSFQMKTQ